MLSLPIPPNLDIIDIHFSLNSTWAIITYFNITSSYYELTTLNISGLHKTLTVSDVYVCPPMITSDASYVLYVSASEVSIYKLNQSDGSL